MKPVCQIPWEVIEFDLVSRKVYEIVPTDADQGIRKHLKSYITSIETTTKHPEVKDIVNLIAAAPELLQAVKNFHNKSYELRQLLKSGKNVEENYKSIQNILRQWEELADDITAKAEGKI